MGASSGNISILTLTVKATAVIPANRFVERDGTLPAAGGNALGVTRFAGEVGDLMAVDVHGTTIAECGAAVAIDSALMVDAAGKVVVLAGSGKQTVGRALEAGTADGSKIEILLIPSTGLVSA